MILPFIHDFLPLYSTMTVSQIVRVPRVVFLYYYYHYYHSMYVCIHDVFVCMCVCECAHVYAFTPAMVRMRMSQNSFGQLVLPFYLDMGPGAKVPLPIEPSHQPKSSVLTACFLPFYIQLCGRALFFVCWICE